MVVKGPVKTFKKPFKRKKRIREFFSNNGSKYINKCFQKALNNYSIIYNTAPIYTKEPNGLIERINLTLLSKVRSLLIMANAPKYLWGEALLASTYLYNRNPP
jgi:transposase InsO family protein